MAVVIDDELRRWPGARETARRAKQRRDYPGPDGGRRGGGDWNIPGRGRALPGVVGHLRRLVVRGNGLPDLSPRRPGGRGLLRGHLPVEEVLRLYQTREGFGGGNAVLAAVPRFIR